MMLKIPRRNFSLAFCRDGFIFGCALVMAKCLVDRRCQRATQRFTRTLQESQYYQLV